MKRMYLISNNCVKTNMKVVIYKDIVSPYLV